MVIKKGWKLLEEYHVSCTVDIQYLIERFDVIIVDLLDIHRSTIELYSTQPNVSSETWATDFWLYMNELYSGMPDHSIIFFVDGFGSEEKKKECQRRDTKNDKCLKYDETVITPLSMQSHHCKLHLEFCMAEADVGIHQFWLKCKAVDVTCVVYSTNSDFFARGLPLFRKVLEGSTIGGVNDTARIQDLGDLTSRFSSDLQIGLRHGQDLSLKDKEYQDQLDVLQNLVLNELPLDSDAASTLKGDHGREDGGQRA